MAEFIGKYGLLAGGIRCGIGAEDLIHGRGEVPKHMGLLLGSPLDHIEKVVELYVIAGQFCGYLSACGSLPPDVFPMYGSSVVSGGSYVLYDFEVLWWIGVEGSYGSVTHVSDGFGGGI